MDEITLDSIRDDFDSAPVTIGGNTIPLAERGDAETIKKTLTAARKISADSKGNRLLTITEPPAISSQVENASFPLVNKNGKQLEDLAHRFIDPTHVGNSSQKPDINFVLVMARLVKEMLELTHDISERDRTRMEGMKKEFHQLNKGSGDSIRSRGNASVTIAVIGFAAQFGALAFTNPEDQRLVRSIAEQFPQLGSFYTSRLDADQSTMTQKMNLLTQEISNLTSSSQNQGSWKQELIQLLKEVTNWLANASRTGG